MIDYNELMHPVRNGKVCVYLDELESAAASAAAGKNCLETELCSKYIEKALFNYSYTISGQRSGRIYMVPAEARKLCKECCEYALSLSENICERKAPANG